MQLNFNTFGRVFVSTNPANGYQYYGAMAVGAVDKTLPAKESVYAFDSRNKIIKVAEISDGITETTSSLTGYVPLNERSNLEKLISARRVNIQVHYGTCTKPTDFEDFQSALVLKGVNLTSHNMSEASTITQTRTLIQETATITVEESYRVFPMTWTDVFGTAFTSFIGIDMVNTEYCSTLNQDEDLWVLGIDSPAYFRLYVSKDKGKIWEGNLTNLNNHTDSPTAAALKSAKGKVYWSIVVSSDLSLYAADIDTVASGAQIFPSLVYTDDLNAIRDMSVTDKYLWCAGGDSDSFVLKVDLSTHSTEVIDAGGIFSGYGAYGIDALTDNFVVVVGEQASYAVYRNGEFEDVGFIDISSFETLTDIRVLTEDHWVVGSQIGVYVTFDGGLTWTHTLVNGISPSPCKLAFFDEIVGYASFLTDIYRTMDGGRNWILVNWSYGTLALDAAISPTDPNLVFFMDTNYLYKGQV